MDIFDKEKIILSVLWKKDEHCHLLSSGAGCSKLTMSLVDVSLNFQKLILQIHC